MNLNWMQFLWFSQKTPFKAIKCILLLSICKIPMNVSLGLYVLYKDAVVSDNCDLQSFTIFRRRCISMYVGLKRIMGNFWMKTWLRVKAYWLSVKNVETMFCAQMFMQLSLEAFRLKNIWWRQKFNFKFKCWNWERRPFERGCFWTNANSALTRNYHKPCTVSNAKDIINISPFPILC